MELAELADVLPAEVCGSDWGELGLEGARGSAEPPESAEGSSPIQDLPASSSHQQNGTDSPIQSPPVSPTNLCPWPCLGLFCSPALLVVLDVPVSHAAARWFAVS